MPYSFNNRNELETAIDAWITSETGARSTYCLLYTSDAADDP